MGDTSGKYFISKALKFNFKILERPLFLNKAKQAMN